MEMFNSISIKKILAASFTLLFAMSLSAQSGQTPEPEKNEKRIALIIGNGSYKNAPLKNPINDAKDLAAALKGLGFSVALVMDGDLPVMSRAIRDFGNAIKRPDAVALFYYSGHGVQYRGSNYLIPAKTDIQDPDELAFSAVNSDQVYAKMESSGDRMNIVILDACRNNPFPGSERSSERGLAVVGTVQPPQSLIVYATAPGRTAQDGEGRNGVFTQALLKHLAEPNLDVELMIRRVREDVITATNGVQVPWHNSSIAGAGFFFSRVSAPAFPAARPRAPGAAEAGTGKSTGTLTFTSEPPGMRVIVDEGEEVVTPASLDLDPGAHSFTPVQSLIGDVIFAGQPLQWITVAAGSEAAVPIRLKAVRADLDIRLVPEGYTVFVNDEERGVTPVGRMEAAAGILTVRFEKEGEKPRIFRVSADPGKTASVSWGKEKETAVILERRTIEMDGKPDSWGNCEPLYETDSSVFMGETAYGIKRLYMCRDEKYLYWRVDFQEKNPLKKIPKGISQRVESLLTIFLPDGSWYNLSVNFNKEINRIQTWRGHHTSPEKFTTIGSNDIRNTMADDKYVARLEIKKILEYANSIHAVRFALGNAGKDKWLQSVNTENFFVDFSK